MGFSLWLTSNSPAIMQAARAAWRGFGPEQPTASPDFIFRLFEHAETDPVETVSAPPIFRLDGPLLYQTIGRASTLLADLSSGQALGYFSAATLANLPFFRWHFLELALFMMLEGKGLMGVHGSALAKNGKALLLRAPSGGGKTTLAYAAARSRFQALAEEVVWLDYRRNLWWGLPWHFHLLPSAKSLFPELAGYPPVLHTNGELKLEVNLEQIRPGSTTVSAQPSAVVLLERLPGGQSRLEPLSLATLQSLWPTTRAGLELKLPHHSLRLAALWQLKLYRLYFGDDIETALKLLEPLFD